MSPLARVLGIFGLLVLVFLAARLSVFAPVDLALQSARFAQASRPPSGDIVLVDVDSASLLEVGLWPWPRRVHADGLRQLLDWNAHDIVYDIDFSAASNPTDDDAFEQALAAAGGYAWLAAFQQVTAQSSVPVLNWPLQRFLAQAEPVLVNVETDYNGVLQAVPSGLDMAGRFVPSVALALEGVADYPDPAIAIDWSIDLSLIDRISFADVLAGRADPQRLRDKQVVIGATAIELRDFFTVPRFGAIPGPLVQVAAAETIRAGRALIPLGLIPAGIVASLVALFAFFVGQRIAIARHILLVLAVGLLAELGAWAALRFGAVSLNTAPLHFAMLGLVIVAFFDERATRRRAHDRTQRQRALMQHVLDRVVTDNFSGILVLDAERTVLAASQQAGAILMQDGDLTGRQADTILPTELYAAVANQPDTVPGEAECDIDWQRRTIEFVATRSSVDDPDRAGTQRTITCLTFADVTDRRRQEKRLAYLARHDAVTGALSRQSLVDEIDGALGAGRPVTVVVIRLARMRIVTETLGHKVGDRVLRLVFKRLRSLGDMLPARLGGDTFALVFTESIERSMLSERCRAIADTLERPYHLEEHTAILGVELGVSTTALSRGDAAELLRHADIALTAANTKRDLSVFSPELEARITARQSLDVALRKALRQNEFYLLYQPQVSLCTGAVIGVEALVRWQSAELGTVSPAHFIPLAEETGLIVQLGDWVIRTACQEAASWPWDGRISVNVSAVQFRFGDVLGTVDAALRESGLSADRLDIEITESLFVDNDTALLETLGALRAMGVGIAIDDFGTGYSSLSYLGRLPVDKIKLDQSFVRDLDRPDAQAIVDTVVAMAQRLGKPVIAEGIETPQQQAYLHRIGCQMGQGYLFGRPMLPAALPFRVREEA